MILKVTGKNNWIPLKYLPILGLGLAFCVGALPAAAQQNQPDQPGEVQGNVAPPDSRDQGHSYGPSQQQPDPQAQGQPNQPALPQ